MPGRAKSIRRSHAIDPGFTAQSSSFAAPSGFAGLTAFPPFPSAIDDFPSPANGSAFEEAPFGRHGSVSIQFLPQRGVDSLGECRCILCEVGISFDMLHKLRGM